MLVRIAGEQRGDEVMDAGERMIERGRAEGIEKGLEKGREEGRAQGLRFALETSATTRGIALSQIARARIAACTDIGILKVWVGRACTATAGAEIFVGDESA